jgi:hypothetical protein
LVGLLLAGLLLAGLLLAGLPSVVRPVGKTSNLYRDSISFQINDSMAVWVYGSMGLWVYGSIPAISWLEDIPLEVVGLSQPFHGWRTHPSHVAGL